MNLFTNSKNISGEKHYVLICNWIEDIMAPELSLNFPFKTFLLFRKLYHNMTQWIFNFYSNWILDIFSPFNIKINLFQLKMELYSIMYICLWTYLYFAFIKIIIVIWNCSRIDDLGDKTIWKCFRVSLCECVYKLILCFFCLVRSSCFVHKKKWVEFLSKKKSKQRHPVLYCIQSNIKKNCWSNT